MCGRACFSTRNARLETQNFNSAGFVLLELVVVLLLIGVILGLSSFYFTNRTSAVRLDATGREIVAGIRHARWLALAEGENRTFTINLDNRSFRLEGYSRREIPSGIAVSITDGTAGEIQSGLYTVTARSEGGIEGGIISLNAGKRSLRIQLDPVVGARIVPDFQL